MKKLYEKLALFKAGLKQGQPKIQLPKIPEIKPIKPITVKKLAVKPLKIPAPSPDSKKDPKKVAQQIKDGSLSTKTVKLIKINETKKLEVIPKGVEENYGVGYRFVDGNKDSFPGSSKEQIDLNHGINMASAKPIGEGAMGAHKAFNVRNGYGVIIKNADHHFDIKERGHDAGFNSTKREVLYHDMAHGFFNLGQYVPTTAGFTKTTQSALNPAVVKNSDFSAMKEVPGATRLHFNMDATLTDQKQKNTLSDMDKSGDMHKIAMMDNIMGNHDRHGGNYVFDKDSKLHLIDHGTSFDYINFDPIDTPHFYRAYKANQTPLKARLSREADGTEDDTPHPEAIKWLENLNHEDALKIFKNAGISPYSDHAINFMTRLANLKHLVKSYPDKNLVSILKENRLSSGPMHPHHEEPAALAG